jgi:hypothetical protein
MICPKGTNHARCCEEGALPDEAIPITRRGLLRPFGLAMTEHCLDSSDEKTPSANEGVFFDEMVTYFFLARCRAIW